MKVLCDLDSTINICLPKFLKELEELTDVDLSPKDIWTYDLSEVIQDQIGCRMRMAQNIVSTIFNKTGFFKDLPLQPHCREVIDRLHEAGHEITIATKAFLAPNSMKDKLDYVRKYFPYANLIFCDKKINMTYHLAVEDNLEYLNDEICADTKVLLDRPYNQGDIKASKRARVKDWLHLNDVLEKGGYYEKQS